MSKHKISKKVILVTTSLLVVFILSLAFINRNNIADRLESTIYYLNLSSDRQELYNKMYIEGATITKRTTGTEPFNTVVSDLNGNDNSADDEYVRTSDKVKYVLEIAVSPNNKDNTSSETTGLTGGVIKVKATLPNQGEDINLTWVEDGWMKNVSYNEDKTEITAEFYANDTTNITSATQELSFSVLVGGYKLPVDPNMLPEFEVWMEGNSPDNASSTAESVKVKDNNSPFLISGTPSYNIELEDGWLNSKGTQTINGTEMPGRYKNLGIGISLEKLDGMPDFRGVEYPKGNFNTKIKLEYRFRPYSGGTTTTIDETTEGAIDLLNGTFIQGYGINAEKKDEYNPQNFDSHLIRELPAGNSNLTHTTSGIDIDRVNSVYDSGTMTASLTDNYLNVTFENFKFDGIFPTMGSFYPGNLPETSGYFATGNVEFFYPYYGDQSIKTYYYLYAKLEEATYTNSNGETNGIKNDSGYVEDKTTYDNTISIDIRNFLNTSYAGSTRIYVNGVEAESKYGLGDGSAYLNENFNYTAGLLLRDGDFEGGADGIAAWNPSLIELQKYSTTSWYQVLTFNATEAYNPSTENVSFYFGISKEFPETGFQDVEAMNKANYDDFNWFETYDEAITNGKVTAIYLNDPDYYGNSVSRQYYIKFKVLDNLGNIGKTAPITSKINYYEDIDRTLKHEMGNYTNIPYKPATYDGKGHIVTYEDDAFIGETVLITSNNGATKTTASKDGIEKDVFEIEDETLDLKITPTLKSLTSSTRVINEVLVTTTLPNGLKYKDGTANKVPESVTVNEDGTTTLIWKYEKWQVNTAAPDFTDITFTAEISSTTPNNTIYTITTTIFNEEDLRDEATFRTNIKEIKIVNLSGSQIAKETNKKVVDVAEDFTIKNIIGNTGQKDLLNARTTEIFPKNNDDRGSIIQGSYTLEVKSLAAGQKLYYSTKDITTLGLTKVDDKYTSQNVDLSSVDWIEVTMGDIIPNNATIIISQFDNIVSLNTTSYEYTIHTSNNKAGDKFILEMYLSSDSTIHVIKNNYLEVSVANRTISGSVISANENTIIPSNIKVNLLDENNNILKTTQTDSNNKYTFTSLPRGNYYISFEIPNNFEVSNILTNKVDALGKTALITEQNTSPLLSEVKVENTDMVLKNKEATLTVHHYLDGTTTSLVANETSKIYWGDTYTTKASDKIPTEYELVAPPANATGTVSGDITVNYYYKLKTATLTIHHYIENTVTELAPTESSALNYTDTYTTKPSDKIPSEYKLVKTPDNATGTINGNVTVNYYYKLKTATLTVHHYIEGTTTELASTETSTLNYTDTYTTKASDKIPTEYELVATPANATGTISGDVTVNYYYKLKTATLTIHHYIENTVTELAQTETSTLNYTDTYTTKSSDKIPSEYELVKTPDNATGTISGDVTVNYYYKLKKATLTVHHYIEGMTTELASTETSTLNYTDTYTTKASDKIPTEYELVAPPANATGTINGDVIVIYYYRLKGANLIIHHYIEGTTTELAPTESSALNYTDTYTTKPSDKIPSEYELVKTPDNATGTINGNVTVNYYYKLKKATLTVHHYIEGTTTELASTETSTLNYTDTYTTKESDKVSINYELVATPANATGTINGDVIVIYYYRLKSATITINYYLENSTIKIINSDVKSVKWGEDYQTTSSPKISVNYELIKTPDNANGTVSSNTIEINYYYRLKTATLTVHHYIENTTTSLAADEIKTINWGENYTTSKSNNVSTNFELVKTPTNATGTISGDVTVIYYYKIKKSTLVVKHLETETNKVLAPEETKTINYGEVYKTAVSKDIPTNYEYLTNTNNFEGIVDTDNITVIYYYQKKNSTLSTTIKLTTNEEITKLTETINNKITYEAKITDYIGNATITITHQLPYSINVSKSNLDGGTYNSTNNIITWVINKTNIDTSTGPKTITETKNITLVYTNIPSTEKTMVSSVTSNIVLDNNSHNSEDQKITYIKIPGTIIVHHYQEGTTNKIVDDITSTGLVGEQYISEAITKEGYILVKEPTDKNHIYTDGTSEVIYEYKRIQFNLKTKVIGNGGGSIVGDEVVFYGDSSTPDKIVITPNEGYIINEIKINGIEYEVTNNKKMVLGVITDIKEDIFVEVSFIEGAVVNPDTSRAIKIITIIGLIALLIPTFILIPIIKKRIIKI